MQKVQLKKWKNDKQMFGDNAFQLWETLAKEHCDFENWDACPDNEKFTALPLFGETCRRNTCNKYVIHSESEEGFWSTTNGWGELENATIYHRGGVLDFPVSCGQDTETITIESALEYQTARSPA